MELSFEIYMVADHILTLELTYGILFSCSATMVSLLNKLKGGIKTEGINTKEIKYFLFG